jgi:hypothetical protein
MGEAPFRCGALPQVCPPVEDETYHRFFPGETFLKGKVIEIEPSPWQKIKYGLLKRKTAACTTCETETSQRICPVCHGDFSLNFYEADRKSILILCQTLQEANQYIESLRKQLDQASAHTIGATLLKKVGNRAIGLKFEALMSSRKWTSQKSTQLFTYFYPVLFTEIQSKEDILKIADAGIVILNGDVLSSESTMVQDIDSEAEKVIDVVEVISHLLKRRKTKGVPFKFPMAYVITKLETFWLLLPKASIFLRQGRHEGGYDALDGKALSAEAMAYMGSWCGTNFLRLLKEQFSVCRWFCVSVGGLPTYGKMKGWRIEDPFFWILERWGKIGALTKGSDSKIS